MSQPVSTRWYPALQSGAFNYGVQFLITAPNASQTILYESPVLVNPGTPTPTGPNPIITGGNVQFQKNQDRRSKFQLEMLDPSMSLVQNGWLSAFGNQMMLKAGLVYPDNTSELVQLGNFRITDVDADDEGNGTKITVQGEDLSRIVSRASIPQYYQTAGSQTYTDAIRAMVLSTYPQCRFDADATTWSNRPPNGINLEGPGNPNNILTPDPYGVTFQQGDDLWTESRNMAASLTCDLFFDRYGVCTLVQDPNLNYMNGNLPTIPSPVYRFIEGETATFTGVTLKQSDQDAYNQWVITGEGQVIGYTQAPLQNYPFPVDNDSTSPTYFYGPYGQVCGFETNQLMVSQQQINLYGQFKLATSIGKQQSVQLNAFSDPSLDLDDPIEITRQAVSVVNQAFIIYSIQIPLTVNDKMVIGTRERRALSYSSISESPS